MRVKHCNREWKLAESSLKQGEWDSEPEGEALKQVAWTEAGRVRGSEPKGEALKQVAGTETRRVKHWEGKWNNDQEVKLSQELK